MISKKALQLIEQFNSKEFDNNDLHLKDDLFEGAEFFLTLKDSKIANICGSHLNTDGFHSLLCADLELVKKIGPRYLLQANFREIENYIRDDNSKQSFETVFSYSKNWQSAHAQIVKQYIFSALLQCGVKFSSWNMDYQTKTVILREYFCVINGLFSSLNLGSLELIALEENNVYLSHHFDPNPFELSLLDAVADYLNFCLGSNLLKLVAQ